MAKPEPIKILTTAWEGFKLNWIFWTIIGVIFTLFKLPFTGINQEEVTSSAMLGPILGASLWVILLNALISPFIFAPALLSAEKKDVTQKFLPHTLKVYFKLFFYGILYMFMVIIGLVALIFPGVYLGARYSMGFYVIYNNPKIPFFEAFTKSSDLTEGKALSVFACWFFVTVIVNVFGSAILEIIKVADGFALSQVVRYLLEVVTSTITNSLPAIAAAAIYLTIKHK